MTAAHSRLSFLALALTFAGETTVTAGEPKQPNHPPVVITPPARSPLQWSVRAGAAYRNLGDISFRSGSSSSPTFLPANPFQNGNLPGNPEALGIGPANAFADRDYQDGFVFIDDDTTNPNSFLPGTTAFWGYESASQVRDGSLFFSGGEYTTSSVSSGSSSSPASWSSDFEGASPVLELEALYPLTSNLRLGGTLGFLFASADASHSATTFRAFQSATQSTFSVTDRYDLQGVIPPTAPYAGTFTHPGTAPLIDNIPSGRLIEQTGTNTRTATYFNTVAESLDIKLSTFSLGPTLRYETGRFSFAGSLGLAVSIADWEAAHEERLYQGSPGSKRQLRKWSNRKSDTDILPGFYLQGAAGYQIAERWQISVFGRYDWSESLSGSVGPSQFSAELSGYSLGSTLTFSF